MRLSLAIGLQTRPEVDEFERLFDTRRVLDGRSDIIGDLARLRRKFMGIASNADDLLGRLEVLAAAAVELAMSHNIVRKASGIPRERIDAVLDAQPTTVSRRAADYERHPSGAVCVRKE